MSLVSRIFYFFAPYTDTKERSVGLFFKGLSEHGDRTKTRRRLDELLQRDIAVINLWSEYRYKGYRYLRKRERRKLYANLQLIADDFMKFQTENARTADSVTAHIHRIAPYAKPADDRVVLLQALMDYFAPGRIYEYRESSSFGRLLRDPAREKLIGDCNQIVTLYIYLYSQYFDVSELQVRQLPGHVALHYQGVDIEATNGTFANYDDKEGAALMPIEEIVSINLLDTTDSYLATHEVSAEDFLQASRFAFILSHDRTIVTRNLEVAYGMLINALMKRHNYHQALKFALASRDMELIAIVGHNGAVHEMQQHNYASARRFAEHTPKRAELIHSSYHAEGARHYEAHRYHDAIRAFEKIGETQLVRHSYEGLFFEEQAKLGKNLTTTDLKNHAGTLKRMRTYAKKSGNSKLVEHTDNLLRHTK